MSCCVQLSDPHNKPSQIRCQILDFNDAIYFVVITVTLVGYGSSVFTFYSKVVLVALIILAIITIPPQVGIGQDTQKFCVLVCGCVCGCSCLRVAVSVSVCMWVSVCLCGSICAHACLYVPMRLFLFLPQYNTTQHSTIQYNTIQHNTAQHNTIQHNTTLDAIHYTHPPFTCYYDVTCTPNSSTTSRGT